MVQGLKDDFYGTLGGSYIYRSRILDIRVDVLISLSIICFI